MPPSHIVGVSASPLAGRDRADFFGLTALLRQDGMARTEKVGPPGGVSDQKNNPKPTSMTTPERVSTKSMFSSKPSMDDLY